MGDSAVWYAAVAGVVDKWREALQCAASCVDGFAPTLTKQRFVHCPANAIEADDVKIICAY